jgi:hypothetical protein
MLVVKFFACLDFEQVSADSENPNFARGSTILTCGTFGSGDFCRKKDVLRISVN